MQATIPLIGHIIGVIRNKYTYYIQLRYLYAREVPEIATDSTCSRQAVSPIFTMTMPGTKLYIVTKPEMIQAVQKQPKVLAFPPVEAKFASKICGASAEAHKVLMTNVNGDEGDWGLSMESYEAIRATLAPGPGLDEMNHKMVQNIAASLDSLRPAPGKPVVIGLGEWLFSHVTTATTNSVYGPQNPFKDSGVTDGFWYVSLIVGIRRLQC